MTTLPNQLRELRERQHLSQEKLAEIARISANAYSDVELGKRNPRYDTLQRIADALGVEVVLKAKGNEKR